MPDYLAVPGREMDNLLNNSNGDTLLRLYMALRTLSPLWRTAAGTRTAHIGGC